MRIQNNRVFFTRNEVAAFNARWPGSSLRDRGYWFEFDCGDLVDTNVSHREDGPAAAALAEDAARALDPSRA